MNNETNNSQNPFDDRFSRGLAPRRKRDSTATAFSDASTRGIAPRSDTEKSTASSSQDSASTSAMNAGNNDGIPRREDDKPPPNHHLMYFAAQDLINKYLLNHPTTPMSPSKAGERLREYVADFMVLLVQNGDVEIGDELQVVMNALNWKMIVDTEGSRDKDAFRER